MHYAQEFLFRRLFIYKIDRLFKQRMDANYVIILTHLDGCKQLILVKNVILLELRLTRMSYENFQHLLLLLYFPISPYTFVQKRWTLLQVLSRNIFLEKIDR